MFDLEKAIKAWKKDLARNPSLEDTYIFELEAALRDEVADLTGQGGNEEEAFRKVCSEMGETSEIGTEFSKVRSPRGLGGPLGRRPLFRRSLFWSYARLALRKIRLQKGYSFINIAGLAVGLACCILMMLWVQDELSFDRFHENRDSIYRLITETKTEAALSLDARAPTPIGPTLESEFPEVLEYCRYQAIDTYGIRFGDKAFFDDVVGVADPSFFTMFSFPFLKGNPKTALVEPRSIVVTESLARKFFGSDEPMGKILMLPNGSDAYTVTGVIRDVPENSHLHFDCVIPSANMHEYHHVDFERWESTFFYCYVRLAPQTSPSESAKNMTDLIGLKMDKSNIALRLQPLKDVHLRSNFAWDSDNYSQGSYSTLQTFSIAALAVLLLACINFMNLSTARSANRGREVGLRKVTGARRSDLIKQFLGESIVLSFISLVLALLLVWQALPLFNSLAGKQLNMIRFLDSGLLPALFGITVLTGLVAGSYPALFLSSFQPARVLKGGWFSGGRGQAVLRRGLVVVQFALTAFLVIGTIVVDKQLKYIRAKNLGIDTHQVLTILLRANGLKEAMLADPKVISMTQSLPPGQEMRGNDISWEGKNPEDKIQLFPVPVDADYLKTFSLEIVEGRFFSEELATDRTDTVVINQTAAVTMGIESPVGKRLTINVRTSQGTSEQRTYSVIGIMKDFHQTSLYRTIEPMYFTYEGDQWPWLNIRISPSNIGDTMKSLEKTWKSFIPNYPFTFSFLDDKIDGFYKREVKTKSVLGLFTILALFTACLGLSGLASFIAERRTKEIGIRRVLGAPLRGLVLIQIKEFAIWVLLANAIAWPLAYIAVGRWLQGFAYRVSPGIEPAAVAAAFSLTAALLSVGYKAVRASLANPVDSLKYE